MVPVSMTLSDLEWLFEISNNTKHRAVSLRQLSFFVSTGSKDVWHVFRFRGGAAAMPVPRRPSFHLQQQQRRRVPHSDVICDVMRQRRAPALAFPALPRRGLHLRARSLCTFTGFSRRLSRWRWCFVQLSYAERRDSNDCAMLVALLTK